MRVQTLYTDSSGTYRIRADIRENNRSIHIIDIIDNEYGSEADLDDFTDDEKGDINHLLLEEYDELNRDGNAEFAATDSDGEEDEGDELPSDY